MSEYPSAIQLSSLNGTNVFRLDGVAGLDKSGWSVSSAGDINGNGFADLIVGAETLTPRLKQVILCSGHAGGFAYSLSLSSLSGTNGLCLDGGAAMTRAGQRNWPPPAPFANG
jgi:FG-GAP repeat